MSEKLDAIKAALDVAVTEYDEIAPADQAVVDAQGVVGSAQAALADANSSLAAAKESAKQERQDAVDKLTEVGQLVSELLTEIQ